MPSPISFKNLLIPCETRGSGAPTLLVHGSGVDHSFWSKLAGELTHRKLYLPDTIGHGKTPAWKDFKIDRRYRMDDDIELLTLCSDGVEGPIDLIGHSFGGALCVAFAMKYPKRVGRMVLIEPNLPTLLKEWDPDEWDRFTLAAKKVADFAEAGNGEESAKTCFEYNLGAAGWSNLPDKAKALISILMLDAIAAQTAALAEFSLASDILASFNFPILVIAGTNTCAGLRKMSEAFHKLVSNGKLELVEGASHMLPSTHSAIVNRLVVEFIGR